MSRTTWLPRRRDFLVLGGAGLAGTASRLFAAGEASHKPLQGIFPIAQTPFTESNKLDLDALAAEVRFIDRGRVHGFVWPQLASEWSTLSESERLAGAETIASVGKPLRPAIVLGVQATNTATAVNYARQAAKLGADAIISLPPAHESDPKALTSYYAEVAKAAELPMFVQAVGNMSVETVVAMSKAIPNLRYVKDEAGQPLMRVEKLRNLSGDRLKVFSGGHGRTLIDEMIRGFSGSMPAASFADIYAAAWDAWHAGKQREAIDIFGRAAVLINEIGAYGMASMKYILCLRGVFKTYRTREAERAAAPSAAALAAGSASSRGELDESAQRVLREMMDLMKPYFRA